MTGAVGAVGGTHGGSNDTALLQAMLSDAISQVGAAWLWRLQVGHSASHSPIINWVTDHEEVLQLA
jgi:hypothetical protein